MVTNDGSSGLAKTSVLVTGGGSGIGLGVATALAAEGVHVTICGRSEEKLTRAAEQITADNPAGGTVDTITPTSRTRTTSSARSPRRASAPGNSTASSRAQAGTKRWDR